MIGLVYATAAGRAAASELAVALGPDARLYDGPPGDGLRSAWQECDGIVAFLATGATVRLLAPLLADKHTDPGVVCVDEARRYAVALVGGHGGGANALAARVADALGATPVVTTATDAVGMTPLDEAAALFGCTVHGDLAGLTRAVLDGVPVAVRNPHGLPLPALPLADGDPQWTLVLDDAQAVPAEREVRMVPADLVVGIGCERGVSVDEVTALLDRLPELGFDPAAIGAIASLDLKADEAALLAVAERLGVPFVTHPAAVLSTQDVPTPSEVVSAEVGTPSVAEASALVTARARTGGEPELVVPKQKQGRVTMAVARARYRGRLAVVGLGPGAADLRSPRAEAELRRAAEVVGLDQYVAQIRHLLRPGTRVHATGLGSEEARARSAVDLAREGRAVALIGSGDAGVYAMASPALEHAGEDVEVVGVPGITAALASAAVLGAPLGHDHAMISLSDLHTPWPAIERRVRAAAEADLVVCFYNPRSKGRDWQLGAALDLIRKHRPDETPVAAVRQASRPDESVHIAPIADFDPAVVDMYTTVVVGASTTRLVGGRMVTPRGYRWMGPE
ncbi:MAG: cobalt-precorrin hydrolase / cobalt-factor methyltransferase / precorrin-3B [Actinomycetota bacterium]|nr:cobalt-precorrin hydrolase / cobalt-factor methyltransferase / precorrin-3B [Actinomycetota bacterium]